MVEWRDEQEEEFGNEIEVEFVEIEVATGEKGDRFNGILQRILLSLI